MEKRLVIFSVMLVFFIGIVSGSYSCSDGSSIVTDQDEISLRDKESINGLGLGLTYADEILATSTYSAELIVDTLKFSLTNDTSSIELELKSGDYTLSLVNLSSSLAKFDVDGSTDTIEEDDIGTVGGLSVLVINTDGIYPGIATVEGLIGKTTTSLTNSAPAKIVSIDNIDYLLELFSASDNNAIIKVSKCDDDGAIIETEDAVDNSTVDNSNNESDINTTINNESSEEDINITVEIDQTQEINNETQIVEDIEADDSESEKESSYGFYSIILWGVIGLVLIVILVLYFKRKKMEESVGVEVGE